MLTGGQLRAARALLGWSSAETAAEAGLTRSTVERIERSDGVPSGRTETLAKLERALSDAGIEFVGTPEDGPGVRLWKRS